MDRIAEYKKRIKAWVKNQVLNMKTNLSPGEGTRNRIKREIDLTAQMVESKNIRATKGLLFEKEICKKKGWARVSKSPKMKYLIDGRTNFHRIYNTGFDPSKLLIDYDKSVLVKYDAVDKNNNGIEIKSSQSSNKKWTLYSEPFFCVKGRRDAEKLIDLYGDGNLQKANDVYNKFVSEFHDVLKETKQTDKIINNITESNIGIRFKDKFVHNDNIEFKFDILKNKYKGFDRLTILYRVK
jgi:hypothetical protein